MIILTAEISLKGKNENPFILGESKLGEASFGAEYYTIKESVDKKNILSLESEIRDRAEIDKPSFGLISSGGRLSFRDTGLRFLGYANEGILQGDEIVNIFLCNTISGEKEKVGERFATNWKYNTNDNTVEVNLVDGTEELQDIVYNGFSFDYFNSKSLYVIDIYDKIYNATPEKYKLKTKENLGEKTKNLLEKSNIGVPFLNPSNLWSQMNKISNLCLLHIYKNKNGEIVTVYDGGA
jgi:hypothetical protein